MRFTLKQLMLSMALIAVAANCVAMMVQMDTPRFTAWSPPGRYLTVQLYASTPAFLFGGVGVLFNRADTGIAIGYLLLTLFALVG